jgi:hypothetical protein
VGDPPGPAKIGQDGQHLGPCNALVAARRAKADAEKPDAGVGIGHTVRNQHQFRAGSGVRFHRHQFHPVAYRADRADKIMANA